MVWKPSEQGVGVGQQLCDGNPGRADILTGQGEAARFIVFRFVGFLYFIAMRAWWLILEDAIGIDGQSSAAKSLFYGKIRANLEAAAAIETACRLVAQLLAPR